MLIAGGDGSSYHFRHALLRQAVLDELLPDERVALHRAIAAALTADPAVAVGVDRVAELARHWDAARDASSALRWLVAAAEQAEQSFAFEAAFDDYERALGWWESVDDAPAVAGIDHAALLLDAADAAGLAGRIGRAADLAQAGLDEAYALDASRGVEAAGRVYPLLWQADRAAEWFDFSTTTLLPVLDRVDPVARARFLVSRVEHLVAYGTPAEVREPAAQMMDALRGVNDPVLEARAHLVSAWCYEAYGDFEQAEAEYERAAEIARDANAQSMLALGALQPRRVQDRVSGSAGFRDAPRRGRRARRALRVAALPRGESVPTLAGTLPARRPRRRRGRDGIDRRRVHRGIRRVGARDGSRRMSTTWPGIPTRVLRGLQPETVGAAAPKDSDLVIETEMLRADALAWNGDVEGARRAVDRGEAAVAAEHYRENTLARPPGDGRRARRGGLCARGGGESVDRCDGERGARVRPRSSPRGRPPSRSSRGQVRSSTRTRWGSMPRSAACGEKTPSLVRTAPPKPSRRSGCRTTRRTSAGARRRRCWTPVSVRWPPSS